MVAVVDLANVANSPRELTGSLSNLLPQVPGKLIKLKQEKIAPNVALLDSPL